MSIRRQLQDAIRTQDLLDLEKAISSAREFAAEDTGSADSGHDVSRTTSTSTTAALMTAHKLRGGGFSSASDMSMMVVEAKKLYLEVARSCKHLIKPLRRAVRELDGPGIIESLDRIYRSSAVIQKSMAKDVRVAERTLDLMSHAAQDAPLMARTNYWGDVDRYLMAYSGVLTERVVFELTNLRDGLHQLTSPRRGHVSPSPQTASDRDVELSVSPPQASRASSVEASRFTESRQGYTPPSALQRVVESQSSLNASSLPTDIIDLHHRLMASKRQASFLSPPSQNKFDASSLTSRRVAANLIEALLKDELQGQRDEVVAEEHSGRIELYQRFFAEWATSASGIMSIRSKVEDVLSGKKRLGGASGGKSRANGLRWHYEFLPLEPPAAAGAQRIAYPPAQQYAGAVETPRMRGNPVAPSASPSTLPAGPDESPVVRSGALSPASAVDRQVIFIDSSRDTSAANSAPSSRTGSPTPLHPTGELHHDRPPLPLSFVPAATTKRASDYSSHFTFESKNLFAEEAQGRVFIDESEEFARGTELTPRWSRLRLATRTNQAHRQSSSQIRLVMTSSDLGHHRGSALESQASPKMTLGRWSMNRDPYYENDLSPQRVPAAYGTSGVRSSPPATEPIWKSPSPPSASDE